MLDEISWHYKAIQQLIKDLTCVGNLHHIELLPTWKENKNTISYSCKFPMIY